MPKTIWIDFLALVGLGLTTLGFAELGVAIGAGASLALLWSGGWLITVAYWAARLWRSRR